MSQDQIPTTKRKARRTSRKKVSTEQPADQRRSLRLIAKREKKLKLMEDMAASNRRWRQVFENIFIKYSRVFDSDEEQGEVVDLNDLDEKPPKFVKHDPYNEVLDEFSNSLDEHFEEIDEEPQCVPVTVERKGNKVKQTKKIKKH